MIGPDLFAAGPGEPGGSRRYAREAELDAIAAGFADAVPEEPAHIAELLAAIGAEADEDPYGRVKWNALTHEEQVRMAVDGQAFREGLAAAQAARERPLTPEERSQLRLIAAIPAMDHTGARMLAEIPADPPAPLLLGRLHPTAHTILYGTGGSRKGTVAAAWIGQLVAEGHRVLIVDYEDHPDEWSSRVRSLHGTAPLGEVLHVAPAAIGWHGKRGPLWRQAPELCDLADAWEASYIVVDSIVVACGGEDPMDPGTPAKYAAGLQQLGRPVLSLAHVTKDGGLAYPFGSVFWHNLARATWSLELDGTRSALTGRKVNQHERSGRFLVDVTYRDNLPVEVWERPASAVLADRVAELIAGEPGGLTVPEIVARLEDERAEDEQAVKGDTIRKVLRRGLQTVPRRFTVTGTGHTAKWAPG